MLIDAPDKIVTKIINGQFLAEEIKLALKKEIKELDPKPGLAIILIGDNPASQLYVNLKKKACEFVDIELHRYLFPADKPESEIIETINFLNADPQTNGILVQLPLPEGFDTEKIISAIDPRKDVDGFHSENLSLLKAGTPRIISPLVLGVDALLQETKEDLKNKKIVIFSNSEVFAEPFKYFYQDNEVVSITPRTEGAKEICHSADILITAIGQAQAIGAEYIKKDAIVIDVGINKKNNLTVGDINFDNVLLKTSFISPVPGGVGPMTIAFLLKNTLELYRQQN